MNQILRAHRAVPSFFLFLGFALLGASACAQQTPPPPPSSMASVFSFTSNGAYLGVTLKDVTAGDVQSMKLPGVYGAIVTEVESGSPAAKCGLQVNDVILEFGGMRVWSASQLADLVRETPPERTVSLLVSRAGEKLHLEASLSRRTPAFLMPHVEMPRINVSPRAFNFAIFPPRYRLGVRVETLTSQLASYFGVKQGKGVLVTEVEPNSPAAKAGMKAGDCIVAAGSTDIADTQDLTQALNAAKISEMTLSIVRSGREETLTAKLEPASSFSNGSMQNSIERQIHALEQQVRMLERQQPQVEEYRRQIEGQARAIAAQAQNLPNQARLRAYKEQLRQQVRALEREEPRLEQLRLQLQRLRDRVLAASVV